MGNSNDPSGEESSPTDRNSSSDRIYRVSRRTALKIAGAGGALINSVPYVGASENKVEIVTKRAAGEVYQTELVPQSWKERSEHARDIHRSLIEQYSNKKGVKAVSITRSSEKAGNLHLSQPAIHVDPSKISDVSDELPHEVEGVPIQHKEFKPHAKGAQCSSGESCWEGTVNWDDPFSAAQPVFVDPDESHESVGTAGYRVTVNGDDTILTSYHIFYDGSSCDGYSGEDAYSLDCNEIGTYVQGSREDDWIVFEPNSGGNITDIRDRIRRSGWVTNPLITSYYTADGVEYIMDNRAVVWKSGIVSGHSTGYVEDHYMGRTEDCIDTGSHFGIDLSIESEQGDSGGPSYTITDDDSEACMIGHTTLLTGEQIDPYCSPCEWWQWDCTNPIRREWTHALAAWRVASYSGYEIGDPKDKTYN